MVLFSNSKHKHITPLPQMIAELKKMPEALPVREKFMGKIEGHPVRPIEYQNDVSAEESFRKAYTEELNDLIELYSRCIPVSKPDGRDFKPAEFVRKELNWGELSEEQAEGIEQRIKTIYRYRALLEKAIKKREEKQAEIEHVLLNDRASLLRRISSIERTLDADPTNGSK